MDNSNDRAKTFAQSEQAAELAAKLNRERYNWDELAEFLADFWSPQLTSKNLLLIYFEFTEYYFSDPQVCGANEELYYAMCQLRSLYEIISRMDKGPETLQFTPSIDVTTKQQ